MCRTPTEGVYSCACSDWRRVTPAVKMCALTLLLLLLLAEQNQNQSKSSRSRFCGEVLLYTITSILTKKHNPGKQKKQNSGVKFFFWKRNPLACSVLRPMSAFLVWKPCRDNTFLFLAGASTDHDALGATGAQPFSRQDCTRGASCGRLEGEAVC